MKEAAHSNFYKALKLSGPFCIEQLNNITKRILESDKIERVRIEATHNV
jgi:hypothetical protein